MHVSNFSDLLKLTPYEVPIFVYRDLGDKKKWAKKYMKRMRCCESVAKLSLSSIV